MQQQSIRSIALRCLSAPTGLAFSEDEKIIYVSETGKNRILRFYESKEGIYYMRYFYRYLAFSINSTAGLGPLLSPPPTITSSSLPSFSSGLFHKTDALPSSTMKGNSYKNWSFLNVGQKSVAYFYPVKPKKTSTYWSVRIVEGKVATNLSLRHKEENDWNILWLLITIQSSVYFVTIFCLWV